MVFTRALRQCFFNHLFLVCAVFSLLPVKAQSVPVYAGAAAATRVAGETGLPYLRNYSPKEYNAFTQNWAVGQDPQGVLVIGNEDGLLRYNGVSWQLIETPTRSNIRSLAVDQAGRVYAGGTNDFGYLENGPSGRWQFVSLLPKVNPQHRQFSDVWTTLVTPEGIFFQSEKYVFRLLNGRVSEWQAGNAFSRMYWLRGKLYVQDLDRGLFVLQHNRLSLVSQEEVFTKSKVHFLLPLPGGNTLVGTWQDGLFEWNGQTVTPWKNAAGDFARQNNAFHALLLPDSTLAIATSGGGVLLADPAGNVLRGINEENGLASNKVHCLSLDREGNLWMALEKGIAKAELFSPFSLFTKQLGLEGTVKAALRHQGKLYVATNAGVFALDPSQGLQSARFRLLSDQVRSCWHLLGWKDGILIASNDGVYLWRNGRINLIAKQDAVFLHRSRQNPDRVLIANRAGLATMRWNGNAFVFEGPVPGFTASVHTVVEDKDGDVWLPTHYQGIFRVRLPQSDSGGDADLKHPHIEQYGPEKGLPSGYARVNLFRDQVFGRVSGHNMKVFPFDKQKRVFGVDSAFGRHFGIADGAMPVLDEEPSGRIWIRVENKGHQEAFRTLATPRKDGSYHLQHWRVDRITENIRTLLLAEGDSLAWYGGVDGLIRHDLGRTTPDAVPFATLISRITLNRDSTLYPHPQPGRSELPFAFNSLRFEFGGPSYQAESENEFQYQLEGYDEEWSVWSRESYKEYTKIPAGQYTFRVRGRNLYGTVGREAAYAVRILPPWYLAWPLYLVYALLSAGAVYGIVRWRLARVEAEKLILERIIGDRTREVAAKNEQLAAQATRLQELDQVKSNFFANISHEFRTPLTLILGSLQDKLEKSKTAPQPVTLPFERPEVSAMHRNARRLLELINQLLDLSRLESGRMQLESKPGDLSEFFRVMAGSFSSLAQARQITFALRLPETRLHYLFDADKLEKIVVNLLSNAFKFTPDGGAILLQLEARQTKGALVRITVQDSGTGIPADQLQSVFNRFYQGAVHYSDQQGTGIGLALVKEMVALHGGQVFVESDALQGTRFVVELPLTPVQAEAMPAQPADYAQLPILPPTGEAVPAESAQIAGGTALQAPGLAAPPVGELPLLLIVEDNADLRAYIRKHLEDTYRVLESENGRLGLETALREMPDLIITDLMMPEMDGMELCEKLKTDPRTSHVPVIMLTALATQESKLKGLETGADEYLTKPFDARELLLRVGNLVESRRRLQEKFARQVRISPKDIAVSSVDEKLLEKMLQVVEENMGNPEFGPDAFAREVAMSRMQLHRKITALTGKATTDFIRTMRLKRAAQLLEARAGNVSEIAYQVGFDNLPYFSKCFKEQFGVPASEYAARQVAAS